MSNYNSKWNPSVLSLDGNLMKLAKTHGGGGRQVSSLNDKFIKGPIGAVWLIQASKLGVTPLLLGLVLWYLSGLRKATTVQISNVTCREWGIEPDAKRRALLKLEKAGLIEVERVKKRSPKVTLVVHWAPAETRSSDRSRR
jgi:DNA-binding transcriptional ArsR family regulator